jgi:cobaltochelatase CobS
MKLTKLYISGVKPNGGVYNNKISAYYVDGNDQTWLLHNIKDFNAGTAPLNKRGYLFSTYVGETKSPADVERFFEQYYGAMEFNWEGSQKYAEIDAAKSAYRKTATAPVATVLAAPTTTTVTSSAPASTPAAVTSAIDTAVVDEPQPTISTTAPAAPVKSTDPNLNQLINLLFGGMKSEMIDECVNRVLPTVKEIAAANVIKKEYTIKTDEGTRVLPADTYHNDFDFVLNVVRAGVNVYLYGPAGTGKTHMARQIANILCEDFYYVGCVYNPYELLGTQDIHGNYVPTEFYRAFAFGGRCFFDEIDTYAAECMKCLSAALSNGYCVFPVIGRVEMHPNFKPMAAANTLGLGRDRDYVAAQRLDASTLDRFPARIYIDYDEELESAMADSQITNFIHDLRKSAATREIKIRLSMRVIKAMQAYRSAGIADEKAVEQILFAGISRDDVNMLYSGLTNKDNQYALATSNYIKNL